MKAFSLSIFLIFVKAKLDSFIVVELLSVDLGARAVTGDLLARFDCSVSLPRPLRANLTSLAPEVATISVLFFSPPTMPREKTILLELVEIFFYDTVEKQTKSKLVFLEFSSSYQKRKV